MKNGIILALVLFVLSAQAKADSSFAQQLHEIRTEGFLLCANLLAYYNSQDPAGAFYPASREAYRQSLAELDTLTATLKHKEALTASLREMKSLIGLLEKQPENNRIEYSTWLDPVLRAQGDFDELAAAAYQESGGQPAAVVNLHQQSLDISRMLLLYESQAFRRTGIYSFEVHDNSFNEIDQRIGAAHKTLEEQLPQAGNALTEVWRNYRFIRQRLQAREQAVLARSASLYLGKSVDTLDLLARNVGQVAMP